MRVLKKMQEVYDNVIMFDQEHLQGSEPQLLAFAGDHVSPNSPVLSSAFHGPTKTHTSNANKSVHSAMLLCGDQ